MSTRRVTFLALSTLATAGVVPLSSAHATTGTTIYVGRNGSLPCSDSGPGTASAPFCTFPEAMNAVEIFGRPAAVSPGAQASVVTAVGGHLG